MWRPQRPATRRAPEIRLCHPHGRGRTAPPACYRRVEHCAALQCRQQWAVGTPHKRGQLMITPAVTLSAWPVMAEESSHARNRVT